MAVVLVIAMALGADADKLLRKKADALGMCGAQEKGARALLQSKVRQLGVPCEDMCKKMGAYPNCQCPGFEGAPASDEDTRACMTKYCQDPAAPCPNDAFVTCVDENTKVSVLQWDALMSNIDAGLASLVQTVRKTSSAAGSMSCNSRDTGARALLQSKVRQLGVPCEDMCKSMGVYPNCQCPGFEGEPSSDDDTRACMTKYCQDPAAPCPNDAFVTCVKENTKVSVLQWDAIMTKIDAGLESLVRTTREMRKHTA